MINRCSNKPSRNSFVVTQKISDFENYNKNVHYKYWLKKLGRKDILPRGKFFKGKVGGTSRFVVKDESHMLFFSRKGEVFPYDPFKGETCNFDQLVSKLPNNYSGKSRVVDSIINPDKD